MKKLFPMMIACLAFATQFASAVTVDDFLARAYTNASGVLPYRLFKPANYNPTNKYPIVLFLHGAGDGGTNNTSQLTRQPSCMVFADAPNQAKNPSFMIAPQLPNNVSWSSSARATQVYELMNMLTAEFSIDPDRVYVTGLSMGGSGSWYYITQNPQMYAAAAPIATPWDNYYPDIDISHMPVWSFYGAFDSSPESTKAGIGNLRRVGCNLIYTEYANGFHNIWVDAYANSTLLSWMYAQKRGAISYVGPQVKITNPTSSAVLSVAGTNASLSGVFHPGLGRTFRVDWTNFSSKISSGLATFSGTNWALSLKLESDRTNIVIVTAWNESRFNGPLGGFTTFNDTVAVIVPPSITRQPLDQILSAGQVALFNVVIPDYVHQPRYQWLHEGQPLAGATNASLTVSNIQFAQVGNYSVVVSNSFGVVTSSNAVLEINRQPVARCKQLIVAADDRCLANGSVNDGSFDPDGDAIQVTQFPSGPYPVGTNEVTLVVTDSRGSSNSCVAAVIVLDRTPPQIACPSDIIVTNAHDQLTSIVNYAPSATDTCGSMQALVCHPPSGSALGVGTHTVTCDATDNSGNVARCTFQVTVLPGNQAPVPNIVVSPLATFPGWTNLIVIAADGCEARVRFDGSGSFDPDDAVFKFAWLEGTNLFSTNAVATRELKLGTHEITLTLDDTFPMGISSTNVELEVISGNEAVAILLGMVMDSGLTKREQQPLIVSLRAAAASFERGQIKTACNQLRAFQNKVVAQMLRENRDLAEVLIESAEVILDAVDSLPRHKARHEHESERSNQEHER